MAMCVDRWGSSQKLMKGHAGPEARVFDAARVTETPNAVDAEQEKQARTDMEELEAWLRDRGGKPWFDGIVSECLERFPRLDRFQVSEVIYKLRDEDSKLIEEEATEKPRHGESEGEKEVPQGA
jgi:hypothetical protein